MKRTLFKVLKRNEIYIVAITIAGVFISAMLVVGFLLRDSLVAQPYEVLGKEDLNRVFATGYLRFKEDNGNPYLKVELHNGTLWWIKSVDLEFAGKTYSLGDANAFKPLHFGAVRLELSDAPQRKNSTEYDLKILSAAGYPPAEIQWSRSVGKITEAQKSSRSKHY